ncbi:ABC transporter substrate-binding protein [Curtobacterium sp. MCPF17_021]|uniref:ABC transporter substrate-binding protein n=1 Tax=Curtobacterium sp. MCPF17_021 TaxID=2175639 RepID=UPI000DA94E0D|nr:ABC transporter substrate-binding protein [Curtobacterium sp. MCPF17_021]WIE83702.1 ABC transporter substrate-binding protein [Curtobacterium sp. MCPF17_021]
MTSRLLPALALSAVVAVAVTGCVSTGSTSDASDALVIGTTDPVTSLDPAGAWDRGSYTVQTQLYQHLLTYPAGRTTTSPEVAESCDFTDGTHYVCRIRDGLTFSNGDDLTAKDVVFSFERQVTLGATDGPGSLLANMDSVTADGDEVTFTLKQANDQTFPYVLASMAGAIVDSRVFSGTKIHADDGVVGSGPYALQQSTDGGATIALTANAEYDGPAPKSSAVTIKQYTKSADLKLAVQTGDADVAYRQLTPTEVTSLADDDGLQRVQGSSGEVRFLAFNLETMPGKDAAQKEAVRQAVAATIDRAAIAKDVYQGTYAPAYSIVPSDFSGATDAFETEYDGADPAAILRKAGVTTPVALPIQYTTDHYGSGSDDEYALIEQQLEDTGLFTVALQSASWDTYVGNVGKGEYPVFQLGFFQDYPDASSYLTPAYGPSDVNLLANHFDDRTVTDLVTAQAVQADPAVRKEQIEQIQRDTAESVPLIPLLAGQENVIGQKSLTGLAGSVDASGEFRIWEIGRS